MAPSSSSSYVLVLYLLVFFFVVLGLSADPVPSFGFQNFGKGSSFESQISLYGDASVDLNGSFVKITGSWSSSAGRVMYKKPIKLVDGNPRRKVSFGTYFSFSLSSGEGDGLAFVILPNGFASHGYDGTSFGLNNELSDRKIRVFAVEFDTKLDTQNGDLSFNHVGVDVGSLVSVKTTNLSKIKLLLNSGERLQCWIDYEANSKRVEVRLSNSGAGRPFNPLLSFPIDLSEMFKIEEVFFGISSSNANSTQICSLYSWSFKLRSIPYWTHSQPLDPESFTKDSSPVMMHRKSDCILRVLTSLIFGIGCGALGVFVVLFLWTVIASRRGPNAVAPEECMVNPVEHNADKVNILVVEELLKEDKKYFNSQHQWRYRASSMQLHLSSFSLYFSSSSTSAPLFRFWAKFFDTLTRQLTSAR